VTSQFPARARTFTSLQFGSCYGFGSKKTSRCRWGLARLNWYRLSEESARLAFLTYLTQGEADKIIFKTEA